MNAPTRLECLLNIAECVGGLMTTSIAGLLPLVLLLAAVAPNNANLSGGWKALLWAGACLTGLPSLWYVARFWFSVVRREFPVSLAVALQAPALPGLLRVPFSVYWFLLGLLTAFAAAAYESTVSKGLKASAETWLIILLISSSFAYAGRSYLLLAVGAIRNRHEDVMAVWRCRKWLTVGIVLCSVLLAILL